MSRFRPAVVAVCFAVLLMAALPSAAPASRSAETETASTQSASFGELLLGAALDWGESAYNWLQAIIAADHGTIVQSPATPPPTP